MENKTLDQLMSIDIGNDTFHLVGFDRDGQLVLRKQIKRLALVATFEKLPRCIVGMEACLSAHFVSRTLRKMGFEPRIIPAIYVKPFIKGQKNDYNDAELRQRHDHSRHRIDDLDGHGCCNRHRGGIQAWAGFRRMGRPGSQAIQHRRTNGARPHF